MAWTTLVESQREASDANTSSWPPNAANTRHTVDFRRPWVPSPEMRPSAALPHPYTYPSVSVSASASANPNRDATRVPARENTVTDAAGSAARSRGGSSSSGSGGGSGSGSSSSRSGAASPPVLALPARTRTRTRTRTYGGDKNPKRQSASGASMAAATATGGGGHGTSAYASARSAHGDGHGGHGPGRTTGRQEPERERGGLCVGRAGNDIDDPGPPSFARPRPRAARAPWLDQGHQCECRNGDAHGREHGHERPKSWLSLLSPKKLFSRKSHARASSVPAYEDVNEEEDSDDDNIDAERVPAHTAGPRAIHPAHWRAYGAWARPLIGKPWGMVVHNATPPPHPRELSPPQVDAMIASLSGPHGERHPENWLARVPHPALPPRPDLWPTPELRYDPLPSALQLNPFLQHTLLGQPPLHLDLRMRVQDILLGPERPPAAAHAEAPTGVDDDPIGHPRQDVRSGQRPYGGQRVAFWADGPNGAQPATWPGVPRLEIVALAGDAARQFEQWPIAVLAHHEALPVTVKDVLDALVASFEEFLWDAEVEALSPDRRVMVYQAYWRRMRFPVGGRLPPPDDGLRRVDWLGDNVYFRGLEPAPDGRGFMLFVGPPP